MARKTFNELRVGIFVSLGLLLMMIVIFMIGSDRQLFQRHYKLYANFQSIAGLRVGAPVQLSGYKVGFVDAIRFSSDPNKREITVVLMVNSQFQERIRADSVATVETLGLLGDKYIYVTMGSEAQPMLPSGAILASKETTSIFALADKAGAIMDDIGATSKTINEMIGSVKGAKGESDVKAIVSSLRASVEQVQKGKGLAHAILYDPKGEEVIAELSRTIRSVGDVVSQADEGGKSPGVLVNMRQASADLRAILASVRRGEGTLGKLVMDPELYDELRAFMGRANRNNLLKAVVRSTIEENDRQVLK